MWTGFVSGCIDAIWNDALLVGNVSTRSQATALKDYPQRYLKFRIFHSDLGITNQMPSGNVRSQREFNQISRKFTKFLCDTISEYIVWSWESLMRSFRSRKKIIVFRDKFPNLEKVASDKTVGRLEARKMRGIFFERSQRREERKIIIDESYSLFGFLETAYPRLEKS